jgi:hypothetical protein
VKRIKGKKGGPDRYELLVTIDLVGHVAHRLGDNRLRYADRNEVGQRKSHSKKENVWRNIKYKDRETGKRR